MIRRFWTILFLSSAWLTGSASAAGPFTVKCEALLQSLVHDKQSFKPLNTYIGPETKAGPEYEGIKLTMLKRYLAGHRKTIDAEQLSLLNAQYLLNDQAQTATGGVVFNTRDQAAAYIDDLARTYGPYAGIPPDNFIDNLFPIEVCFDSRGYEVTLRSEGVCWIATIGNDPPTILDYDVLPEPRSECELSPDERRTPG